MATAKAETQAGCGHSVHLYEDDAALVENLGEFAGGQLGGGGACIVIATPEHRRELASLLESNGIDVQRAARENRYLALDAQETLLGFMDDDQPDRSLFNSAIEAHLGKMRPGRGRRPHPAAVFNEMSALLWSDGKQEAAHRVEQLWSELARLHTFSLRCACFIGRMEQKSQDELFREFRAEHTTVVAPQNQLTLNGQSGSPGVTNLQRQKSPTAQETKREPDIEQRRRVTKKPRSGEDFSGNILGRSVESVQVLDLAGRIEYLSRPGWTARESSDSGDGAGHSWVDLWRVEDRNRAIAAIEVAQSGGTGNFHGDSARSCGADKSWDVKITPAFGRDGEIERLIAVSSDVSELRDAQQAAIQAEKRAAAGRLAATIVHEINNPLEAVTNYIYLARMAKGLPEEAAHHLQIADRELVRVARIAQKTLGFYRDDLTDDWMMAGDLLREVTALYERKLASKNIVTEVEADPALRIFSKQGELRQALSNLIANAIDASRTGGRIFLRAHAARDWSGEKAPGVRITLADNGSGMSPGVKKKIFQPFFTTKANLGTGIGLWATKCLIEQQGGHMRFRSRQGNDPGTVMSLFLPGSRLERKGDTQTPGE